MRVTLPRQTDRALTSLPVYRDELAALLPVSMPADSALSAADLAAMPLIFYERGADTRSIIDAWFGGSGLAPKPVMELGSVEAIKVLVASGLGASVLPSMALVGGMTGAVVQSLRSAPMRVIGLVMRKEKVLDRGLRVFREALLETDMVGRE